MEKAKKHLLAAAEAGNAFSQRVLGIEYYQKQERFFTAKPAADFPQDSKQAHQWATLAAEQGDAGGHYLLTQLYRYGHGVSVDHELCRSHLESAVKLKYDAAMNEYFWELCEGKLFKQDYQKAFQIANESADLGHANGHYNTGFFYHAIRTKGGKQVLEEDPLPIEYTVTSHKTLHHYLQAYKLTNHPKAKEFLETYRNWYRNEKAGKSMTLIPRGCLWPGGVYSLLERDHPESAKELTALFELNKMK